MTTINQLGLSLLGSTGTGSFCGSTSPTLITPILGTPSSGVMSNCTNASWGSYGAYNNEMFYASGTVSAAQIKALNASPVTIVPAQGANTLIYLQSIIAYYTYSAPAYTASASQTIRVALGTNSIVTTFFTNGTLIGTANAMSCCPQTPRNSVADTNMINTALVFWNPIATEVTNGNSTLTYFLQYNVIYF